MTLYRAEREGWRGVHRRRANSTHRISLVFLVGVWLTGATLGLMWVSEWLR